MSGQSGELDSENLVLVTFDLKKKHSWPINYSRESPCLDEIRRH